jgi:hypothetical protein
MVSFIEGLEDWGIKEAVDKVLDSYTVAVPPATSPLIPLADRPKFEQVSIDIVNALLALAAQKVGVPPDPDS